MTQIGLNKDIPIEITIQDEESVVINTDTFTDIEVAIYQRRENVIQFFKKSAGQVEVISNTDGLIKVRLDRKSTSRINELNPLYLEVVPVSADENFEEGLRRWDAIVVKLPAIKFSSI